MNKSNKFMLYIEGDVKIVLLKLNTWKNVYFSTQVIATRDGIVYDVSERHLKNIGDFVCSKYKRTGKFMHYHRIPEYFVKGPTQELAPILWSNDNGYVSDEYIG